MNYRTISVCVVFAALIGLAAVISPGRFFTSADETPAGDEHAEHEEHDADHEHAEHEHEHDADEHGEEIALDDAALANLGIGADGILTLEPATFHKSFTIPGAVVPIPAKSLIRLTAPAAGTIAALVVRTGETLCPGEPVLEIALTHADAIECQSELLELLQERDILELEEKRLGSLDAGIAPQAQRDLNHQKIANDARIEIQRDLLHIHGITDAMIDENLVAQRETITRITIRVPEVDGSSVTRLHENAHAGADKKSPDAEDDNAHYLVLERLPVERGFSVSVGDTLCEISDLRALEIEGVTFASDESALNRALLDQSPITAVFDDPVNIGRRQVVSGLTLDRLDNRVDSETQSFGCRVKLSNYRLETPLSPDGAIPPFEPGGKEPIHWRFKPGQKCDLEISSGTLENVFILPPEAVAFEPARAVVFEYLGECEGKKEWRPVSVHVVERSRRAVAVEIDDEHLPAGTKIARTGASRLLVACGAGGKLQSACGHDHSH